VNAIAVPSPAAPRGTAGIVSRALAFTVDALLLVGGLGVLLVLAGVFGAVLGWELPAMVRALAAVFGASLPVLWVVLNAAMWAIAGRTPGQALFGLRVVRTDGTPVRLGRACVRSLCYLFSIILLAGCLWILVDRRRQAWHDKLAGTLVVYDRRRALVTRPG
jgi:uncharacterized RDD family membrane protein YckC